MAPAVRSAKKLIPCGPPTQHRSSSRPEARSATSSITIRFWALGLLLATAGCAAPLRLPPWSDDSSRSYCGAITQIFAIWADAGVYADGSPVGQGLAGRIYLFGAEGIHPVFATGTLAVYVYDESSPSGRPVQPSFQREFTPEELVRHEARDIIGPSYLVWIPITDRPLAGRKLSILVRFSHPSGQETLSGMASVDIPAAQSAVIAASF